MTKVKIVTTYKTIVEKRITDLDAIVSEHLTAGWELYGDQLTDFIDGVFCQVVILMTEVAPKKEKEYVKIEDVDS